MPTQVLEWTERCKVHLALPAGGQPSFEHFYAAMHPEDRPRVEGLILGAVQGLDEYQADYRIVQPDGGHRWISASGRVFRSAEGAPVAMGGVTQDITARKEAEAALYASEERMRLFIDHAPASLAVFDLDMRYLAASRRWREDRGLGDGDLVGVCHYDVLPEISQEWRDVHRRALAGEPLRADDDRLDRREGRVQWLHREVMPWRRQDGSIGGIMIFSEDITQRKEAEQRLRESEQRFRELFEHLPVAYQSLDEEGRWLDANLQMARLLGFETPAEMTGLSFSDYWDESTREDFASVFAAFKECQSAGGELHLRRRDGTPVTAVTAGRAQFDAEGRFLRTHCVLTDISERRAMEEEIRALNASLESKVERRTAELLAAQSRLQEALAETALSEARYRTIFEQAPLGVALIDSLTGEIYAVNDRFAAIAGRTREEMAHIDWMRITHPDDVQEDLDNMGRLNAGEISGFQMNKRYLWPDGTPVWISMTIAPLARDPGESPRHLCMIEDISQRKQLEEELAASEARYRLAVDATSEGMWDVDLRTGAQVVNDHWFTLLGYAPGEVEPTYERFRSHLHPDDLGRFHRALDGCLEGRLPRYECEYRVVTKAGEIRWHRGLGKVVDRDASGAPIRMVGTFVDITDQVEAASRIQETMNLLQLATRAAEIGVWSRDLATNRLHWDERMCSWYEVPEEARPSGVSYDLFRRRVHPDSP